MKPPSGSAAVKLDPRYVLAAPPEDAVPRTTSRRQFLGALGVLVGLGWAGRASAADVAIPVALQVALLARLAGYDKNLPLRAGGLVRTLIVVKQGSADSAAAANHAKRAFGEIERIGGLPHEEEIVAFSDAPALAAQVRAGRIAIVDLMPDLSPDVPAIRDALDGISVLHASTVAADVARGIVVGFDQVSGKPKLLVNLPRAERQQVKLSAELLRIATVIR